MTKNTICPVVEKIFGLIKIPSHDGCYTEGIFQYFWMVRDDFDVGYLKLLEQYQSDLYDFEDFEEEKIERELFISHSLSDVQVRTMKKEDREKISVPVIDLSNAKMEEISEKIHSTGFLRVFEFLLRITNYRSLVGKNAELSLDIFRGQGVGSAYGFRLISRHNFMKDARFSSTCLPKIFGGGSFVPSLAVNEVAEIIRILQVVQKCAAFL